jgi:hypothetical protein
MLILYTCLPPVLRIGDWQVRVLVMAKGLVSSGRENSLNMGIHTVFLTPNVEWLSNER